MTDWFVQLLDGRGDGEDEWLGALERELDEIFDSLDADLLGDDEVS